MTDVDEAINNEMGSLCKRSYLLLLLVYLTVDYCHAPQIMLVMFLAPPADAFDYNPHAYNAQTIITEWHLTEKEINWIPGLLQSIFFLGFMVGTVLFGQLSDKYGRRSIGWKVYTILMIAALLIGFTQNWQQMAACRTLSGLGIGGLSVVNTIMLQEMSASKMWVTNGIIGQISFTLFMCVFLIITYYIPTWRTLCVVAALPGLLGYLFYIFTPESPRWLLSLGRVDEAEAVIQKFSKRNGNQHSYYKLVTGDGDIDEPYSDSQHRSLAPLEVKNSILDLVKQPVLRYRTAILSFVWFTTSFVFYCITLGAGSFSPNFYLAFGMSAISQLPSVPICLYFMERKWCGRRGTLCLLMSMTSLSMFIMYIVPNTDANSHFRLILSMVAKVGSSGCFTLIYVYTPELFPTVVRNVGLGSMSTVARIGSMTAPFLATYTVNSNSATPFLCYGILCGISAVLALLLPETCGKKIVNTIDEAYTHEEEDGEITS
uniref:solute carrier family 22 member 15-like n=1 Tax=Styela clava TaxID=7725 RepID=UPI00193A19B7|nr:solute carrier family 22 member 15-like [Styela clava]